MPMVFERSGARVEIPHVHFAANDGEAHMQLTAAGLGVGQHFVRFAQPAVDRGDLVRILPDWQRPAFPMHAVYLRDRHRSARLSAFLDWLSTTIAE